MRADSRSAGRHHRIRNDHAEETAEDYAEAIQDICKSEGRCRVVDLARYFGVSHVTVTKIVKRLQLQGLVESDPYGPIAITAGGAKLARKARRRHRIVFTFLLVLGVGERTAAEDAEGMAHHVSELTLLKLKAFAAAQTGHGRGSVS